MMRLWSVLVLCAGGLVACGADPKPVEIPEPVEKAQLEPCQALDSTYYPDLANRPLEVRHHDIEVTVDPVKQTLTGIDTLTVEAVEPGKALVLFIDPAMKVEILSGGDTGPGVVCGTGKLPAYQVLQLSFTETLKVGEPVKVELHYTIEGADFTLAAPLEKPYRVEVGAQLAAGSSFFALTPWYPMPIKGAASKATIAVTVPAGYIAVSSGEMQGARASGGGDGGVTFTYEVSEPLPQTQPFGLAVGQGLESTERDSVEGSAFPLEGFSIRHVRTPQGGSNENTVVGMALMAGYLGKTLGRWPLKTLTVAEVEPAQGAMGSPNPGLVLVSPDVLRNEAYGQSALFSLLSRQWIQVLGSLQPVFLDGLELYLRLDYSRHQTQGEAYWYANMEKLRDQYAEVAGKGGDRSIAELSIIDELYVPIAFRKVPVALATVALTVGDEAFRAGLSAFLKSTPAQPDEGLGVVELEAAMEKASGQTLTGLFDFVFRGTGLVELEASCASGQLKLEQKQKVVVTPLKLSVVVDGADGPERAVASFSTKSATVALPCVGKVRVDQGLAKMR